MAIPTTHSSHSTARSKSEAPEGSFSQNLDPVFNTTRLPGSVSQSAISYATHRAIKKAAVAASTPINVVFTAPSQGLSPVSLVFT